MINVEGHEKELQKLLGEDDEVQYTERFAMSGYDFIITAGHGFLVVPIDSPDWTLAKEIVKYGYKGELGVYLEEDDEVPTFLKAIKKLPESTNKKKIKLTQEDISKYATEPELYLLEAENTKKEIKPKCSRCGKFVNEEDWKANGHLCDMCADDIDMGRDREDIQKEGTLLKETGEMGQYDIEKDGEWYEAAQQLKSAAQHIQKLTKGMLKFERVRPFDVYQGPYAQCEVLGRWGRLWFGGEDSIDPEYFLELWQRSSNPDDDIAGDVYKIAHQIKKIAKEKYGIK